MIMIREQNDQEAYDRLKAARDEEARQKKAQEDSTKGVAGLTKGKVSRQELFKLGREAFSAHKEIDFSEDGVYFATIVFAIVGDVITIVPIFGNIAAVFFVVIIWTLYFISGSLKNRTAVKVAVNGLSHGLEVLGLGIGMLPFFTTAAVINYWIVLTDRRLAGKRKD